MIEYGKLLIDFGLVVLVWLVHFAIYPSFKFYELKNLKKWHKHYTLGISWVVAPLMLAQLALSIYLLTIVQSWFMIGNFILVASTWVITFLWAIPLHNAIDKKENLNNELDHLLVVNKVRAWIWTAIFIWTLYIMLY